MKPHFCLALAAAILSTPVLLADQTLSAFALDPARVSARAAELSCDPQIAVRQILGTAGVAAEPTGKQYFYNDRTGMLHVRAEEPVLARLQALIKDLQPHPRSVSIEVRLVECTS